MKGILLIDKPEGWTSFDVVKKAKNLIGKKLTLTPADAGGSLTWVCDASELDLELRPTSCQFDFLLQVKKVNGHRRF